MQTVRGLLQRREALTARRQGGEIAPVGGAVDNPGHQAFQVGHLAEQLNQLLPRHGVPRQLRHQPLADQGGVEQRPLQPAPEQTAPHGGAGLVQHPQKAPPLLLAAQRFSQLQIPPRRRVQVHKPARHIVFHTAHIAEGGLLQPLQGLKQCARRPEGRGDRL